MTFAAIGSFLGIGGAAAGGTAAGAVAGGAGAGIGAGAAGGLAAGAGGAGALAAPTAIGTGLAGAGGAAPAIAAPVATGAVTAPAAATSMGAVAPISMSAAPTAAVPGASAAAGPVGVGMPAGLGGPVDLAAGPIDPSVMGNGTGWLDALTNSSYAKPFMGQNSKGAGLVSNIGNSLGGGQSQAPSLQVPQRRPVNTPGKVNLTPSQVAAILSGNRRGL